MNRLIATAASLLMLAAPLAVQAQAQDGYVTVNLNMRAAPDIDYPLIMTIPVGTPITVLGCIDEWLWCDVIAYGERGWVAGDYIEYDYGTRRVPVRSYGASIGIPIISFVIGDYWGRHYNHRPFYSNRSHWYAYRPHNYRWGYSGRDRRHDRRHDRRDDWRDDRRHDRRDDRRDARQDYRQDNRNDRRYDAREQHLPYERRGNGQQRRGNAQQVQVDQRRDQRQEARQEQNYQQRGNQDNRGAARGGSPGSYAAVPTQRGQRGGRAAPAINNGNGNNHAPPRSQAPSNPGQAYQGSARNEVTQVARGRRGESSRNSDSKDESREVRRSGNRGNDQARGSQREDTTRQQRR